MNFERAVKQALKNPRDAKLRLNRAACRRSLMKFTQMFWPIIEPETPLVMGRPIEVICDHLQAVAEGKIRRILINVPPGTMKSTLTSVMLPAWIWGALERPGERVIGWSYAEQLSIRDNLKCRSIVTSELYREMFPHVQLSKDQDEKTLFKTTRTGIRQALGIGGSTTGYRGSLLIVDDPHNVKDGESEVKRYAAALWAKEVLPSRVNDANSSIIIIMQRVHAEDVSGIYLDHKGWDRLILPMKYEVDAPVKSKTALGFVDWRTEDGELLWPERFPAHQVEELEDTLGPYAFAGQYQQRPTPRDGGLFKLEAFQTTGEILPRGARRVRGWDLAGSTAKRSPYTVGVLLAKHGKRVVVEDVVRFKGTPAKVEEMIVKTAERDGVTVAQSFPQDPGQAGKAQKSALAALIPRHHVHFSLESGSKEDRAIPFSSQVEAGNVALLEAAWNKAFLDEAAMFPNGSFKDQIDATSRAYAYLVMRKGRTAAAAPQVYDTSEQADASQRAAENALSQLL